MDDRSVIRTVLKTGIIFYKIVKSELKQYKRFLNTLSGIILEDKNHEDYPVLPNEISRTFLKRVSRAVSRTVANTEMIQTGFQGRVHHQPVRGST